MEFIVEHDRERCMQYFNVPDEKNFLELFYKLSKDQQALVKSLCEQHIQNVETYKQNGNDSNETLENKKRLLALARGEIAQSRSRVARARALIAYTFTQHLKRSRNKKVMR